MSAGGAVRRIPDRTRSAHHDPTRDTHQTWCPPPGPLERCRAAVVRWHPDSVLARVAVPRLAGHAELVPPSRGPVRRAARLARRLRGDPGWARAGAPGAPAVSRRVGFA